VKKWIPRRNQNQGQGGNAMVRPHIHISLGWMDTCARYQLTTFLNRSYYMDSSHVSGMKHEKWDGI